MVVDLTKVVITFTLSDHFSAMLSIPVSLYMCTQPLIIFLARYYIQNFVGTVRLAVEAICLCDRKS